MSSRPTQAQLEALVDFLEQNPKIARGLLRTQRAKQETKRKWNNVANRINALGGVIKDGAGWSKYWAEKNCALKKLCANQRRSSRCTGGGTKILPSLTPVELRMVAVMGGQSFAKGDSHLAVDPFPQQGGCQSILANQELPSQTSTSHIDLVSQQNFPVVHTNEPSTATGSSRRQTKPSSSRSQLDVEVDRLYSIEDRRVEAELRTAQALTDAVTALSEWPNAIREGAQAISSALLEIANRLNGADQT